jgi:AraC-like DNA-binding protein
MDFCKKYTEFPLDNEFNYIGVRFLPTMFPQFFKVDAKSLSNKSEPLHKIAPATANFITNNFNSATNTDEIQSIFDTYFLQLVANTSFNDDHRLYEAIYIILEKFGAIDIENDLNTGISSRQLRRLFEYYIGDTAKAFSKVVRFQNVLNAKPSMQSLRQNKLFFDVGYYDQAHFIKEFKNFYGVTPSKAFSK